MARDDAAGSLAKSASKAAETALAGLVASAIDSQIDNSRASVSLSGVKDGTNRYRIRNITTLLFGTDGISGANLKMSAFEITANSY